MLRRAVWEAFCGGTLITPDMALTAAHGFAKVKEDRWGSEYFDSWLREVDVTGGLWDVYEKLPEQQQVASVKIFVHRKYDPDEDSHGIAVVKLKKAMKLKKCVQTGKLPTRPVSTGRSC